MKRYLIILGILAALVAILVTVIPTAAANQPASAPRVPIKQSTSSNWSGYAVETNLTTPQTGAVTDVKGSWTVPTVSSSKGSSYSSVWVGIDGYSNGTVEQLGTEQDWNGSSASYYAWYEMYPNPSYRIPNSISPSDSMTAEVSYLGNNQFALTLKNITKNWTFSTTQTSSTAQRQSAEWIVEAPSLGRVLPLANFGTVALTNASAILNSTQGVISSWPNDPITMVNRNGTATPSALSAGGSSFTVTYSSSSRKGSNK